MSSLLVGSGHIYVIELLPKLSRVNSNILYLSDSHLPGMDIVHRKQTRNSKPPGISWYEARHPVITVNEVWSEARNDIVYDLALKNQ